MESFGIKDLEKFKPVWVWHPKVHTHFQEKLCYFLLAVKPFDKQLFDKQLQELLHKYGVRRIGCYFLLGSFDILLRVWLSQGLRGRFERDAQNIIRDCKDVLSFEVDRSLIPWGFEDISEPTDGNVAKTINKDVVKRVQEIELSLDDDMIRKLQGEHLLADGVARERKLRRPIKAFIAISAPPSLYGNAARSGEFLRTLQNELLMAGDGIKSRALYSGVGFAWVFVKLVVEDFYAVGELVKAVQKRYSYEGISTSTFVVYEPEWRQGEAISDLAVKEAKGPDREVIRVLPEIYDADDLEYEQIGAFESEVHRVLRLGQDGQLSEEQCSVVWRFLQAVVADNREAAFEALYRTLGATEERLKKNLKVAAGRTLGRPDKLYDLVKSEAERESPGRSETRFAAKSLDTLTLGDVFRAWHALLAQSQEFTQRITQLQLKPGQLEALTLMRNRVMHFGDFKPREQWREWLENLLALFRLAPQFESLIGEFCEQWNKPKQQTTEITAS